MIKGAASNCVAPVGPSHSLRNRPAAESLETTGQLQEPTGIRRRRFGLTLASAIGKAVEGVPDGRLRQRADLAETHLGCIADRTMTAMSFRGIAGHVGRGRRQLQTSPWRPRGGASRRFSVDQAKTRLAGSDDPGECSIPGGGLPASGQPCVEPGEGFRFEQGRYRGAVGNVEDCLRKQRRRRQDA